MKKLVFRSALAVSLAGFSLCFADDSFVNTSTLKSFYLSGVPDFDQRRAEATVTIGDQSYTVLGLAGNGSEYCVVASALDWSNFLANRGFPNLLPTEGDWSESWTDGVDGLGEYNVVDLSMGFLGADMQTTATNGTYGGPAQTGMQQWLDSEYLGQFTTVNIERDDSGFPRMLDMVKASLHGYLVEPYGGWYNDVQYQGSTYLYRNGGHATAMAAASWNNTSTITASLCNPWTYDDMTVQSPYSYDSFSVQASSGGFIDVDSNGNPIGSTAETDSFDYLDQSSLWVLDGGLEIQPIHGYTIEQNWIYRLLPYQYINLFDGSYQTIFSYDQSNIRSATENPLSGDLFYTTVNSSAIFRVDPYTGETQPFFFRERPLQVLFGAEMMPYVFFENGNLAQLDLNSGELKNTIKLDPSITLLYDPAYNSLCAINPLQHAVTLLNHDLQMVHQSLLPAVQFSPSRPVTYAFGQNGNLMAFQTGNPNVYSFGDPKTTPSAVVPLYTSVYLPAVQDADTFSVDDLGRLYFSLNGQIVMPQTGDAQGANGFVGLPAGTQLAISRSVSNYDPAIHATPAWRNTVPDGAFEGNPAK
jgi:hypothetical protein